MITNKKLENLKDSKLDTAELKKINGGDIDWRWRHNNWYELDCGGSVSQEETWWGLYGTLNTDSD
jgi:hypothetical protein